MADPNQTTQQQSSQQQRHGDADKSKQGAESVERTHYLLKNGTTVAIDDYDEKIHGKKVEETDEQYRARIEERARYGRTAGSPMHPRTTIQNLHTYDSTQVQQPAAVAQPFPALGGPQVEPKAVATEDGPNTNLVDPTKPGQVPKIEAPKTDEQKKAEQGKQQTK